MSVVYVDVSAKLENWSADSVIAVTNGAARVLVVTAAVKQAVRLWLRQRYPQRKGTYHALVLLAVLIRIIVAEDLAQVEYIIIDEDYPGEGSQAKLKNELVPLLRRTQPDFSGRRVLFQQVKGTKADRLAREVFQLRRRQRYRHLTFEEIRSACQ